MTYEKRMSADDRETVLELELRNIYCNPATGFQSAEKLYLKALADGLTVTRSEVKRWLHSQKTYTAHFPKNAVKHFQRTYVKNLGDQLQMDLVDMSKFGPENLDDQGVQIKWILTGIEILSRYAFALPVNRKNSVSMVPAVLKMLDEFKDRFKKYPDLVQFDNGKEFYNKGVKTMLKNNSIDYFSTRVFRKAALVERFNRTLKTRMWKYFTRRVELGEKMGRWSPVLQKFITGYNNTFTRGIKMKPNEVTYANSAKVHLTLYGLPPVSLPEPKYKIGDSVRIPIINRRRNEINNKGFVAGFTDEIFEVSAVYRGVPVMYNIRKTGEENLLGKYYERELVLVEN